MSSTEKKSGTEITGMMNGNGAVGSALASLLPAAPVAPDPIATTDVSEKVPAPVPGPEPVASTSIPTPMPEATAPSTSRPGAVTTAADPAAASAESLTMAKTSTIEMKDVSNSEERPSMQESFSATMPMTSTAADKESTELEMQIEAVSQAMQGQPEDTKDNPTPQYRKKPAAKSFLRRPQPARAAAAASAAPEPAPSVAKRATSKRTKKVAAKKKTQAKPTPRKSTGGLVYEGYPDGPFPGGGAWPDGWIKRTYERQNGASEGHQDSYWYTPNLGVKLRSKMEIKRFIKALDQVGGDEGEAKKIYKTMAV